MKLPAWPLRLSFKSFELFCLVLFFLLAFLIRTYQIDDLLTFTYDQGRDFFYLEGMSRGDLKLVGPTTGIAGVFLGPYFYYFLLPGYIWSHGSPFGVVTWQIFWICVSFFFFYGLLKPYVGKWWAMVGYILLVVNPGSIEQSRQIWNPSLTVMTMIPAAFFLFRSLQQPWLLLPSAFFLGLALQTELAYVIFLMPLWASWVIYFNHPLPKIWLPKTKIYSWKILLLSALVFGTTLLPQIGFEIKNNLMMTKAMIMEVTDASRKVSLSQVWRYRPHPLLTELNDSMTGLAPGGRYLSWSIMAISLISLVMLWYHRHIKKFRPLAPFLAFWVGYFWLPIIGMMFHTGNYGHFFDYYITAHYLPMIAILVIFLSQQRWQKITASALLSLYLVIFVRYGLFLYEISTFNYTAALQIDALHYARTLKTEPDTPLEVYVPNSLPVSYEYLNHWLEETNQAEPMRWRTQGDEPEYVLIYEPYYDLTTKFYFLKWREQFFNDTCSPQKGFGITKVRRCYRENK